MRDARIVCEWYDLVRGCAAGLGLLKCALRLGCSGELGGVVRQWCSKRLDMQASLGRARHIQTMFLWVQERVRKGHPRVLRARRTISQISLYGGSQWSVTREVSQETCVSSTLQRRQNTRRSWGADRGVRNGFGRDPQRIETLLEYDMVVERNYFKVEHDVVIDERVPFWDDSDKNQSTEKDRTGQGKFVFLWFLRQFSCV